MREPVGVVRVFWYGIALACLATILPLRAFAQDDGRTYLDVVVNDVDRGAVFALVRGGHVFVDAADVDRLGIKRGHDREVALRGRSFVELDSLAPGVRYRFDANALTLHLALAPELLPEKKLSLASNRPRDLVRSYTRFASLNYAISATGAGTLAASIEPRLSWRESQVLESTFGRTIFGNVARGYTTYTIDDVSRLRRTSIGDVLATSDDFASGAVLGGFEVRRAFALDPYAVTFPLPSLTTRLVTPTVAQVYVNGVLVQTIDLPPGNYTLANLPIRSGITNAQVVLVDAFGRTQTQASQFYGATSLLRRGLTDYAYDVGALRPSPAGRNDRYTSLAATGRYRVGVSDRFTAGVRVESGGGVFDGGGALDILTGARGLVHAAFSASRAQAFSGAAASLGYSLEGFRSALSGLVVAQSARFATLGLAPLADRALLNAQLAYSVRIAPRFNASFFAATTNDRDAGHVNRTSVMLSNTIHGVSVDAAISRDWAPAGVSNGFSLSLTRVVGHDVTSLQTNQDGGVPATTMSLAHASSEPLGVNGAIAVDTLRPLPSLASIDAGLPFSRIGATAQRRADGGYFTMGSLAGAITLADRDVLFSQTIDDGFVILSAPGVARLPAYYNAQYVGRTDARGDVLVPFALSNQSNRLNFSDASMPLDVALDATAFDVAPDYHGGAIVRTQVARIHSIAGFYTIVTSTGMRLPVFGAIELRNGATRIDGRFDADGHFSIDRIDPGLYDVTMSDGEGGCETTLDVPAFTNPRINFGRLTCDASRR